jgi:hypothetical protein
MESMVFDGKVLNILETAVNKLSELDSDGLLTMDELLLQLRKEALWLERFSTESIKRYACELVQEIDSLRHVQGVLSHHHTCHLSDEELDNLLGHHELSGPEQCYLNHLDAIQYEMHKRCDSRLMALKLYAERTITEDECLTLLGQSDFTVADLDILGE